MKDRDIGEEASTDARDDGGQSIGPPLSCSGKIIIRFLLQKRRCKARHRFGKMNFD